MLARLSRCPFYLRVAHACGFGQRACPFGEPCCRLHSAAGCSPVGDLDRSRSTCGTWCLSDYGSLRLRRGQAALGCSPALPQDGRDFSQFLRWFLCQGAGLSVEGGSRPASRPTFWCQKVGKELAPTAHVPPASPAGNLRRQALGAVRPNSLRACGTPFKQTAASQNTKLLHSEVQQPAPRTCRRRRGHKGQY